MGYLGSKIAKLMRTALTATREDVAISSSKNSTAALIKNFVGHRY